MSAIIKEFVKVCWFLVRSRVDQEVTLVKLVTLDKFIVFATPVDFASVRRCFFASNGKCHFSCAYTDFCANDLLPGFEKINSILVIIVGALFEDVYSLGVEKLYFLN